MADLMVVPSPPDDRNADGITSIIEPAPLIDVLFDQLEYLVSHTGGECPAGCPDCNRFAQIKKLLLVPFASPSTPEAPLLQPDSVSRSENVCFVV
jgi:hypothetical protein